MKTVANRASNHVSLCVSPGLSELPAAVQRYHARGQVEVFDVLEARRVPSSPAMPPGPGACGSTRRGSGSSPRRRPRCLPSHGSTLERVPVVRLLERLPHLRELEHEQPAARLEARAASRRAPRSLCVMLRRPKATLTQSKWSAGKGRRSASHCASGATTPVVEQPVAARRASIARLMSVSQTSPAAPTRRANARARSPDPPATSSTRSPGAHAAHLRS